MGFIKRYPMVCLGVGLTLIFLWFGLVRVSFLDTLDLKFYDIMMNLRGNPGAESAIIMVDIDDDSIEKLGRWPWPRSTIAEGIRKINEGKPKVIGLNFVFSEKEESAGLKELRQLYETTSQFPVWPFDTRSLWRFLTVVSVPVIPALASVIEKLITQTLLM